MVTLRGSRLPASAVVLGVALASGALPAGQNADGSAGPLGDHRAIQYVTRPTSDRAAALNQALASGRRSLQRDPRTGYLHALLDALGVPVESQLLVFSKTGAQRAYTGPHTPRALFYDTSVAVGYVPGAPAIEVAAHDPQQGVVFYTVDQAATTPVLARQTSCLTCHVSPGTLNVPGMIARSNTVGGQGHVLPQDPGHEVTHRTPHPDRWGGWFVTSVDGASPYAQRAHGGNITFTERGETSNQVFVDWLDSAPQTRGYLGPQSDVVSLLVFDHQTHAINLLTRLNWEARAASSDGRAGMDDGGLRGLVNELAEYLLFVSEAPFQVPLTAVPQFAARLAAGIPRDGKGRSLAQLELENRLLKYPCSYMIYSDAFDGLPPAVKNAVYLRMREILSAVDAPAGRVRLSAADRRAVLEILHDTKPDFR